MADGLRIDVDATSVLRALDRLDDRAAVALKAAARETAEVIRDNARARLAAQTAGTGATAEAITIDDIRGGFRVYVGPVAQRAENLPLWLEEGTTGRRAMSARPFLFAAARLEEGPHLRRVSDALQAALIGVGD